MLEKNFTSLICSGDVVAVAFSGGMDSSVLLHALFTYSQKFDFTLKAITVEHGIRKESQADADFCKKTAEKYGIDFIAYSVNAPKYAAENGLSLEEAARKLRYDCFLSAVRDGFCNKVAVAHHLSDSAETILFNLFRGSGLSGVSGIRDNLENGIIRPLLQVEKEEIINYAKNNNIEYVTDNTNFDTAYSRNYIRKIIAPKISERFPKYENALLRFSKSAKLDDDYLYSLAEKIVKFDKNYYIDISEPIPLISRAVILILKKLNVTKDYTNAQISAVCELINMQTGKEITLIKNVRAVKEYDKIVFYSENKLNNNLINRKINFSEFSLGIVNFENHQIEIKKENEIILGSLCFDLKKVPDSAIIRHILPEDTFEKFGGGTKSVKKYLTDKKVSKEKRQDVLVVACEKEILIIIGIEISEKLKIDNTTQLICSIKLLN